MAEDATTPLAGGNRACSNGRCGEDEYGSGKGIGARGRGSSKMRSLCYGGGPREKLLHLWRFWAHGPSLQKSGAERKSGRREEARI